MKYSQVFIFPRIDSFVRIGSAPWFTAAKIGSLQWFTAWNSVLKKLKKSSQWFPAGKLVLCSESLRRNYFAYTFTVWFRTVIHCTDIGSVQWFTALNWMLKSSLCRNWFSKWFSAVIIHHHFVSIITDLSSILMILLIYALYIRYFSKYQLRSSAKISKF